MKNKLLGSFLLLAFASCGDKDEGGPSTADVLTALISSDLSSVKKVPIKTKNRVAATLNNISGKADSLLILTDENNCGFTAWSANSQSGAVGIVGRDTEDFDLLNQESWTSMGTGLRDGCNGGPIMSGEAYFAYIDFDITVSGTNYIVRLSMGQYGDYEEGDVLIKNVTASETEFTWVKTSDDSRVAESSSRPSDAYGYPSIASNSLYPSVPYDDGGNSMAYLKLPLAVDTESQSRSVSQDTKKVVFDVDITSAALSISDTSDASAVAQSMSIPFIDAINGGTGSPSDELVVSVVPLTEEEIGVEGTDPAPDTSSGK